MTTSTKLLDSSNALSNPPGAKQRSTLFIAFYTALAIHLVLFGALLWLGRPPVEAMVTTAQEPTTAVTPPVIPTHSHPHPSPTTLQPEKIPLPPTEIEHSTYTIKAGDTLSRIAKVHGTTLQSLRAANALKTDRLRIGQELIIPRTKQP